MHKGLQPTGDFLALLLAETHSAIWSEAGMREVAQDSWAQVVIDCVSSGKKLHHSSLTFLIHRTGAVALGLQTAVELSNNLLSASDCARGFAESLSCKCGNECGVIDGQWCM